MIANQTPDQALAEARQFVTEYSILVNDLKRERDALLEEVRHLKEELAKRAVGQRELVKRTLTMVHEGDEARDAAHGFNTRPFRPVPKKGK